MVGIDRIGNFKLFTIICYKVYRYCGGIIVINDITFKTKCLINNLDRCYGHSTIFNSYDDLTDLEKMYSIPCDWHGNDFDF